MKKILLGILLSMGLLFGSGTIYAQHTVDMPGTPSNEPEETLEDILGPTFCLVDNYGIEYFLSVSKFRITGTAQHPSCGTYSKVTGFMIGKYFKMHVENPSNSSCVGYTYTGTIDKTTRTITGTWKNDTGGGSGSFSMGLCR